MRRRTRRAGVALAAAIGAALLALALSTDEMWQLGLIDAALVFSILAVLALLD